MSQPGRSVAATVAVIAKEPVPGRVKTRLVPPLADFEAAEVAGACLADTLVAVDSTVGADPAIARVLYFEGDQSSWLPDGWVGLEQCAGSLGDRLEALFSQVAVPAVVFGMDTPQLDAAVIRSALEAVAAGGADAVIGPACDGGYWTIGFSRYVPGAFEEVPMSAADTEARQREVLGRLGLSVRTVGQLRDIDHWRDALAIAADHPHLRTSAVVARVADRLDGQRLERGEQQ